MVNVLVLIWTKNFCRKLNHVSYLKKQNCDTKINKLKKNLRIYNNAIML